MNLYDYGARMYDIQSDRTTMMDPHAENYYDLRPFCMFADNPLIFRDPTGMDILFDKDANFWFIIKTTMTLTTGWIASSTMRHQLHALIKSDNIHIIKEVKGFFGCKVLNVERDENNQLKPEPPYPYKLFDQNGNETQYSKYQITPMNKWQEDHDKFSAHRDGTGTGSNVYIESDKVQRKVIKEAGYNNKVLYGHELTHAIDIDKGIYN